MKTNLLLRGAAVACALFAVAACTHGTPASADDSNTATATAPATGTSTDANAGVNNGATASDDSAWQTNGGTACDKYLTPDLIAEVLNMPTGKIEHLNPEECKYGAPDWHNPASIHITLGSHFNPGMFKAAAQFRENLVPLPGVGDMATRSGNGSHVMVDALKGDHRYCYINAEAGSGSVPLKSEPLAQKLGAICNKLFALP